MRPDGEDEEDLDVPKVVSVSAVETSLEPFGSTQLTVRVSPGCPNEQLSALFHVSASHIG